MRILKFLFTSLIVLSFCTGVAFLLSREVLLLWATSSLRSALSELHFISRNSTEYVRECRQKGTPATSQVIERLQLRFVNDHDYVMEAVCVQFPLDPIVIRKASLPPLVKKRLGSSGIVWGNDPSGVGIEVWGRKRDVYVQNEQISASGPDQVAFVAAPQTTCEGVGFQCCQAETLTGIGQVYSDVTDCPRSCFSKCVARPVVLSFTSDPFFEGRDRNVKIGNGESVSFSYVTSYEGGGLLKVQIEYGDGQSESLTKLSGQASHVYQCTTPAGCQYTAQIRVIHSNGAASADTPITRINVIVK